MDARTVIVLLLSVRDKYIHLSLISVTILQIIFQDSQLLIDTC